MYIYGPSETFLSYELFFVSIQKRSTGKLRLVSLAVLTLTAGIEIFGPQKFFYLYIQDPSETFLFYELFFMAIQKMEQWESLVKLA